MSVKPASPGATMAESSPESASKESAEEAGVPSSKATLPVQAKFHWDTTKSLQPGDVAEFTLEIRPDVPVNALSIVLTHTGDLELLTEPKIEAGPLQAGDIHSAVIRARTVKPGKVELRATVTGKDSKGAELFEVSRPLFLFLAKGPVLVGDGGFASLEETDLKRRWAAGEIGDEEYERAKRRIHGGGAQESITVTPPSSSPQ